MKLREIIDQDHIVPRLKARNKTDVLEELAAVICEHEPHLDRSELVRVLLERERLGSTGIGEGVAIPHGMLSQVDRPIVSFGKSTEGVDFDSMDRQPVYLFFLLMAPENSSGVHLQVLAKIAKLLKSSAFRKQLMEANTREDLYQMIIQTDEED